MSAFPRAPSLAAALLASAGLAACAAGGGAPASVRLDRLDLSLIEQGWGEPRADSSVDGNALRIGGETFAHGVGSHADAFARVALDHALRFTARVGVDDEAVSRDGRTRGTVRFVFVGDGSELLRTPLLRAGDAAVPVDLDLRGVDTLLLVVDEGDDGINYDHADWADAVITYESGARPPHLFRPPAKEAVALTPPPPAEPRIDGPAVYGAGPGHPLLYRIPATGKPPLRFAADGLPAGLSLDPATGIITGTAPEAGHYPVTLRATNAKGAASREWTLVVGEGLALTPPMGWNSWNVWGCAVDDRKVRAAADEMVASGLASHGWSYINIDDCWMRQPGDGARDPATGEIRPNEHFPDMKALADYVHSKGLKLGIYTGPNATTCQRREATGGHELRDLETYAKWGIDYVKYDWCSDDTGRDSVVAKYRLFGDLRQRVDRDIVYSLCEYGWHDVWEWGDSVGGNLWRTTGDIVDTWASMSRIGFGQDRMAPLAGPGHWNDPDMLVLGYVGWGPQPRPTRLTPDEQYTHISLWSLLAAPLLIGADMTRLDPFTLNLLTNDEVLAVDQDPLGRQAKRVAEPEGGLVYARPLADGSMAVGIFNTSWQDRELRVSWRDLGLARPAAVRDLWRQKDLGTFEDGYTANVPSHGVVLLKVVSEK